MSGSGKRFVVIVRAGENSLHRNWAGNGGGRNWDLVVSWFGAEPYVPVGDELVLTQKGWKWDVLAEQLNEHPELLQRYDYFWMVDDDIDIAAQDIDRLFELTAQHGLAVSQPALTVDSYFSHMHTIRCPSFTLRYTSVVEVMAPCLSRATLRAMLPLMPLSPSGFGLDFIWSRLEPDNRRRAAIFDVVTMRHTRPVGRYLKSKMTEAGVSLSEPGPMLARKFGFDWPSPNFRTYAGVSRRGTPRGRWSTAACMLMDYFLTLGGGVQRGRWRKLRGTYRNVWRLADLSMLHDRGP